MSEKTAGPEAAPDGPDALNAPAAASSRGGLAIAAFGFLMLVVLIAANMKC